MSSSTILTQIEIDKLLADVEALAITDPTSSPLNYRNMICCYCKKRISLDSFKMCNLFFGIGKCKGNSTGHMYVSESYLRKKQRI
jgi:hypothetical protein